MQYFYHVDLVTRNTTKFVSSILEQDNSRYTFYKLFNPFLKSFYKSFSLKPDLKCYGHPAPYTQIRTQSLQLGPESRPGPIGQPHGSRGRGSAGRSSPAESLPVVPPAPTDSSPQRELGKLEKGSANRRYPPRRATPLSDGAAWRPHRRSWPRQA